MGKEAGKEAVEVKLEELQEEYERKDEVGIPMSIRERYWKKMAALKQEVRDRVHRKKLGQVLLEKKILTDEQLKDALTEQAESREDQLIGEVLLEEGLISQEELRKAVEAQVDRNGNRLRKEERS